MENKIQELTDKIFQEGVQKGNAEGQKIIGKAREEAAGILEEASRKAEEILRNARKEAADLSENTRSELKLYAGQALNALKSEIASMLTDKIVSQAVGDFSARKDFMNQFIVSLAEKWSVQEPIVISTPEADALKGYFALKAKELLDKGVEIKQVNGQKAYFTVSPADGSYKVNFGESEFENYFREFLRPQLAGMLF